MKLITQRAALKTVSGGYSVDEFVTANTIFYQSVMGAVSFGCFFGFVACAPGKFIGELLGSDAVGMVVIGSLGAATGAYLGYNYNRYSDIKPNTWVKWDYY